MRSLGAGEPLEAAESQPRRVVSTHMGRAADSVGLERLKPTGAGIDPVGHELRGLEAGHQQEPSFGV